MRESSLNSSTDDEQINLGLLPPLFPSLSPLFPATRIGKENIHSTSTNKSVDALQELFCSHGKITPTLSHTIYTVFGTRLTVLTSKKPVVDLIAIMSTLFSNQINSQISAEELKLTLTIGMGFDFNSLLSTVNDTLQSCPPTSNRLRKRYLHSHLVLLSIICMYSKGWPDFDRYKLEKLCLRVRYFYECGKYLEDKTDAMSTSKNKRKFTPENELSHLSDRETKAKLRLPLSTLKPTFFNSPTFGSSKMGGMSLYLPITDSHYNLKKNLLTMANEFLVYKKFSTPTESKPIEQKNHFSSTIPPTHAQKSSSAYVTNQMFFTPETQPFTATDTVNAGNSYDNPIELT